MLAALHEAEEQAQVNVHQVYLSFSGGQVKSMVNRGQLPVMNAQREVTQEEIDKVIEHAQTVNLPEAREVLHYVRQHYYVDDQGRGY